MRNDALITTGGHTIENPAKVSFLDLKVKPNQKFSIAVCSESGPQTVKLWRRFRRIYQSEWYFLSAFKWDAIAFKPLRDVWFFGFGVCSNYYDKSDYAMYVKWRIGNDGNEHISDDHLVQMPPEDKDPN